MSSVTVTVWTCDRCGECEQQEGPAMPCCWDYVVGTSEDLCRACALAEPTAEYYYKPCHCCGRVRGQP